VQSEKPRKRLARDDRATEEQMDKVGSNEWDPAHDRCADTQPPVGVLVKTHHLPGESHAECEQQ
jgi:hypothetical protein